MKYSGLLLCILLNVNYLQAQKSKYQHPVHPGIVKTINTNWIFNYFPEHEKELPDFEAPDFDDSKWPVIALPHTWQTFETTRELHPYIRNASSDDDPYWWSGWGFYRKRLFIGKEFKGKRIAFEFDGVQKYCKVYMNGKFLGEHKGGYTGFYMDATDAIVFGKENLLAVAVNNQLKDPYNIPPMNAGNFDVYGGIHRDVRLVIKEKVNIPYQGSWLHEGGTFITTPLICKDSAEVMVKTYIRNHDNIPAKVRLVSVVSDSAGFIIQRMETLKTIQAGEIMEFVQKPLRVNNPHLWSPETPYLYKVYSEVYAGEKLSDFLISSFGIRSFSWDFEKHRLVLNGKVIQLHGINRHEEYIWLGAAFPKWIAFRDMSDIKYGLEANFMRTAHYPQDPSIYDFTDQHGICINEELPNIKKLDFGDDVQEQNCREMIRRDRNHPSIIFWSMGNETTDACDGRIAAEEDTTRILTVRQPYNESYNPAYVKHTDKEMPLESFLRCTIRGWYDRDDKNLEPEDNQWAGTEEWQHTQSDKSVISDHNGAVWLYADHGADREYVNAPLKHVNPKGWVDSWRNPKYAYYQWQANFAGKTMVFIHPHFWRSKYLGQKKDFTVDSNGSQVELFVNDKSQGILIPDQSNNYCVVFRNVTVEEGVLEAVATGKDGKRVNHKVVMPGDPFALTVTSSSNVMFSTPDNLIEYRIDIVDQSGIHVTGANNPLRFSVEGPARLAGPGMYLSDRDKTEDYEGTMYIDAPVTALIRATGKTGKVKFTVSSLGLQRASAEIEVLPYVDRHPVKGIFEPVLNPDGRDPVAINLKKANFLKPPDEMKPFYGEIRFPAGNKIEFPDLLKDFLVDQNPSIDTGSPDFDQVVKALVPILHSTLKYSGEYGYIVADDYNFIVNQYNLSRAITTLTDQLKCPETFRAELKKYYAGQIIGQGTDKNYAAEKELLNNIPEGGKTIMIGSVQNQDLSESETDLPTLLLKFYPESADWDKDKMKKALTFIERINPYIDYKRIRDKKTKEYTDSYRVIPGHVILIPEMDALLSKRIPYRKL